MVLPGKERKNLTINHIVVQLSDKETCAPKRHYVLSVKGNKSSQHQRPNKANVVLPGTKLFTSIWHIRIYEFLKIYDKS